MRNQLRYSTYLGGSEDDQLFAVGFDELGDVIVSGSTGAGFPFTADAYDSTYNGNADAFLAGLRPLGNGAADRMYGTFLGGSARDVAWAMAVPTSTLDPVVLGGSARSTDFPPTPDVLNPTHKGAVDAWMGLLGSMGVNDVADPPVSGAPAPLRLGAPHPNPSRGAIEFAIDLPSRAVVRVGVYDARGRLVNELLDREVASGHHVLSWEPKDLRAKVPAGTYFIRLEAGGATDSRKAVIGP